MVAIKEITFEERLELLRELEQDLERAEAKVLAIKRRRREILGLNRPKKRGPTCQETKTLAQKIINSL